MGMVAAIVTIHANFRKRSRSHLSKTIFRDPRVKAVDTFIIEISITVNPFKKSKGLMQNLDNCRKCRGQAVVI
jgi:hypothetical protein